MIPTEIVERAARATCDPLWEFLLDDERAQLIETTRVALEAVIAPSNHYQDRRERVLQAADDQEALKTECEAYGLPVSLTALLRHLYGNMAATLGANEYRIQLLEEKLATTSSLSADLIVTADQTQIVYDKCRDLGIPEGARVLIEHYETALRGIAATAQLAGTTQELEEFAYTVYNIASEAV